MHEQSDVTLLLNEWMGGDDALNEQVFQQVYPEMRRIAGRLFRAERADSVLQPTGVVNEIFLKLVRRRDLRFEDRHHFFRMSARLMRCVLIDAARTELRQKRGARLRVPLTDETWSPVPPALDAVDALDLDRVLRELEEVDPEKLRMVELRFFLGFTAEETAELIGVSKAKVDRDLRFVRGWMKARLCGTPVEAGESAAG